MLSNKHDPSTEDSIEESRQKNGRHTSTGGPAPHRAPSAGLAQGDLVPTTALATPVGMAITTPLSYNRTLRPFTSWPFACKQLRALAHTLFRTDRTTLSSSSLRGTAANIIQEDPCALSNPRPLHHLLSGGASQSHRRNPTAWTQPRRQNLSIPQLQLPILGIGHNISKLIRMRSLPH